MTASEGDAVLLRSTMLRMLHVVTGYSNNTLSCSELNGKHAGEGFRSIRHILTPILVCKAKKNHFSRKFDLWPDLIRSNVDLGPKTICAIARSHRDASTGFFPRSSTTIRGRSPGGGGGRTTPSLHRGRNTTALHFSFGNAAGSCVDPLFFHALKQKCLRKTIKWITKSYTLFKFL